MDANRHHIARYGVTAEDCLQAMSDPIETTEQPEHDEPRWKTTGFVAGRQLEVVWTLRGDRYRVVTAWWKQIKTMKNPPPKFKDEAEEAAWLYDHHDEIDDEWIPVRDENGKPLTPAQIRKRELKKQPAR